jgi:1-deoxy-D-xylulose 5-phosphate reductoisomerase
VAAFLGGKIKLPDIARGISSALDKLGGAPGSSKDELLAADKSARRHVQEMFGC